MAAQRNTQWDSLETQLEFLWYELNGGDRTTLMILNRSYGGIEGLKNAKSIAWATEAFEKSFERAGTPNMANRIQYAYEFYDYFGGGY